MGTIIGFVDFVVANLLNRATDDATVHRPKKSNFSSACEYVKLPFSLFIKGVRNKMLSVCFKLLFWMYCRK
jgi:hypothetical protein